MKTRVLIAEDEPVLASGIRRLLLLNGFEIAGCAASVKMSLRLVDEAACDVALLDVNLRGESVLPVAEALHQLGRPFVFMSGYNRSDVPAVFSDAPFLAKPFDANALIEILRRISKRSNAA